MSFPDRYTAEQELAEAQKTNPGPWDKHSINVALAAFSIASCCKDMNAEKAYVCGILHDIGRRVGIVSEKHMTAGYEYCQSKDWDEVARICITHSYPVRNVDNWVGKQDFSAEERTFIKNYLDNIEYDDYDKLIQLCDTLALTDGLCILEKRFVDVTLRHGFFPTTIAHWKANMQLKEYFDAKIRTSIYNVLPGVKERTFK